MLLRPLLALIPFNNTAVLGKLLRLMSGVVVYTAAVVLIDYYLTSTWINVHSSFHALLGLVLGLMLVFRTNTAYDRWWEGRKLWGQLVNDSRNLALKVQACVQAADVEKQEVARILIGFAYALKSHLRGRVRLTEVAGFENATANPQHVPAYLAACLYDRIERWRRADQLGAFELLFLDRHAAALMDICGACERIRKTPLAISYRQLLRQMIAFYLLTLPWGLVEDLQWWTIPTVLIVGYFMIGIELLAEEVESPFGESEDDLDLDGICATIRQSVEELIPAGAVELT
jgi:putative membrane protein